MSTSNNKPFPDEASGKRATAAQEADALDRQDYGWASVPTSVQPPVSPLMNFSTYLHALRRHWASATFAGLVLAAAAGLGVWFGYGARYESAAYLRVSAQEQTLVFKTAEAGRADLASEFDIYKNTQIQLLKNRFVLTAALRNPDVKQFRIDEREYDPVGWLADQLQVSYPGKAEIMEVRLVTRDPKESATLAGAVVSAYLAEVVDAEQNRRTQRLNDLEHVYAEKEGEVRSRLSELKNLAETLGTSDTKALSLKQQIALEQFGEFQRQYMRTQFEHQHAKGALDAANERLARLADQEISPEEVDAYARNDMLAKQLLEELGWRKMALAETESAVASGNKSRYAQRFKTDLEKVELQFRELEKELQETIRGVKRAKIEEEKIKLQTEVAVLAKQEQELAKQVEVKRAEAEKLSASSIDLEMARTHLEELNKILAGVMEERERLRVEVRSARRINLIQPAEIPPSEYLISLRLALTVMAALAGFVLPVGLIVWWDSGAQLVNSPAEVSKGLGINVIGSMPLIPARAVRRLQAPSRRYQNWQERLSESVDSIAARLLRRASLERAQVILISSATRGEGKTTLATQLALSLARNGRRTALVDFDLRRPALAAAFGLPLEPGLSDVLRGQSDLAPLVQPTALEENLSVVTAGSWDRLALAALANGGAAPIFEQLRGQYEFVVVDASPILPVADTRFVSQHVDAVILSIFRDISRVPKVQAACEILDAFGVRTLEAVFIGPNENLRDKDLR